MALTLAIMPLDLAMDGEFIEDPGVVIAKLQTIRSRLSDLSSSHPPIMAYCVLLDAVIKGLNKKQNEMFYFPIPWEKDTGWPSHPSLVADAISYQANLILDSFASWSVLKNQNIFCCCGKHRVFSRERFVPIEIVLHHSVVMERERRIIEIKQLIGIKSKDQDHVESHYDLRRNSKVDENISIIGGSFARIDMQTFELLASGEQYSRQFAADIFKKLFIDLCAIKPA
jgi:hypothetical protein